MRPTLDVRVQKDWTVDSYSLRRAISKWANNPNSVSR